MVEDPVLLFLIAVGLVFLTAHLVWIATLLRAAIKKEPPTRKKSILALSCLMLAFLLDAQAGISYHLVDKLRNRPEYKVYSISEEKYFIVAGESCSGDLYYVDERSGIKTALRPNGYAVGSASMRYRLDFSNDDESLIAAYADESGSSDFAWSTDGRLFRPIAWDTTQLTSAYTHQTPSVARIKDGRFWLTMVSDDIPPEVFVTDKDFVLNRASRKETIAFLKTIPRESRWQCGAQINKSFLDPVAEFLRDIRRPLDL